MKHVRITSEQDSKQIADLRISEYQSSDDFKLVKSNFLKNNKSKGEAITLGVWNEQDEVIATLVLIFVDDIRKAEQKIESTIPTKISFPALIFRKAATKQAYRKKGLNQLLRYYSIKSALECGIHSLLSPVFEHATRTKFMEKIGYRFYSPLQISKDKLIPNTVRTLAVLNRDAMDNALRTIENSIPSLIKEYPWKGGSIIF